MDVFRKNACLPTVPESLSNDFKNLFTMKKYPVDIWLVEPIARFINNSVSSSLVLFLATIVALILANSPWQDEYHHFWEHTFSIGFDRFVVEKSLHHWINDGLMAVFFFVIGLELKREVMAGELSRPKDALLPVMAGFGGMFLPAVIYLGFNQGMAASNGWGIPMATDIAFALGLVYLLGQRVPVTLKIFLTAVAIADDLGAVLVIALFYTSDISMVNLGIGAGFMGILIGANLLGVRNTVFYGVIGIGGLWLAFLLSGIHATVAGVLAALTIPATVKIGDMGFVERVRALTHEFEEAETNEITLVTKQQLHILDRLRFCIKAAMTPLQQLEHGMHPLVVFVVMPIFALANAGITFSGDIFSNLVSPVSLGIIFGLLIGKSVGISGIAHLMVALKLTRLPTGVSWRQIYGASLLAAVGFTMSLFITDLAFSDSLHILQAKTAILVASLIGGTSGFLILYRS
jgi:Na+:H+ antiporter, NhaA family